MKKTKIVCTIGPATDDENVLRQMMLSGMDVARFNFSHSEHEIHQKRFEMVCRLREELGLNIATLLDTKGPEVRLGCFKDHEPVVLEDGQKFILTTEECEGTKEKSSITFKNLPKDVSKGTRILIDDGAIELRAETIQGSEIICEVVRGGTVADRKGIDVPEVNLSMPYISDADMKDLEFGAKMGFDYIAASFVRTGADVIYLRKFTQSLGWFNPRIIAKIENAQGVSNIDEILEAADGIMVARGDMGVEIPFEQIPAIQKDLITKAYNAGKNVITATQMLESMINHARPTRAEITDVANAIYDGSSAIMLSGETAAGKYPVEAVRTMSLIAETTEKDIDYIGRFKKRPDAVDPSITDAIAHATVTTAHDLDAAAILTVTKGGTTARTLSRFRPNCPIIALTPDETTCHQLNLSWGIKSGVIEEKNNTDDLIRHAIEVSLSKGYLNKGDLVVITAGVPLGMSGTTNLLKVERA